MGLSPSLRFDLINQSAGTADCYIEKVRKLVAGDTVYVKSGIYNERVIIRKSGEPDNFMVFSNYRNDAVTIDGTGISWGGAWNGLLDISEKNISE